MIETFTWSPRVNTSGDVSYRVRKTQFGDGYAQVSGDGPNPRSRQQEVEFTGSETLVTPIAAFLERHQGWKSFVWQPPLGALGLYRCETWSLTSLGAGKHTLHATFIEAFHP